MLVLACSEQSGVAPRAKAAVAASAHRRRSTAKSDETAQLLNKPYVNEVTSRG